MLHCEGKGQGERKVMGLPFSPALAGLSIISTTAHKFVLPFVNKFKYFKCHLHFRNIPHEWYTARQANQTNSHVDTILSNFPKVINQPTNLVRHQAKFQPNYLLCYSARQSSLISYQMDRASTAFT